MDQVVVDSLRKVVAAWEGGLGGEGPGKSKAHGAEQGPGTPPIRTEFSIMGGVRRTV